MASNTMSAAEYKRLREKLGLSNYALAPALGISLRHAQRYEAGHAVIPTVVAKLMRMYAKYGVPS